MASLLSSSNVPIGSICWFTSFTAIPNDFLICNGQSCTAYPKLSALIGPTVPNLLGKFIRGYSWSEPVGTVDESSHITIEFDGNFPHTPLWHVGSDPNGTGWIATLGNGADGHAINGAVSGKRTLDGEFIPMHMALIPCIKAK